MNIRANIPDPGPTLHDAAYLRPAEAAHYISVHRATLDDWRVKGLITPIKIGKMSLYRRSDLIALVESFAKQSAPVGPIGGPVGHGTF